jgi:hypothetical protein
MDSQSAAEKLMDMNSTLDQIKVEMQSENAVGVLLAVQLGASPHELRAILRTNTVSPGGIEPLGHYVITVRNMVEHQVILGMFDAIAFLDDHALLEHHNRAVQRIFISSSAAEPERVIDAFYTLHNDWYGDWRPAGSALHPREKLTHVLQIGYGTLGEVPAPFAARFGAILTHLGVKHSLVNTRPALDPPFKVLMIDDTYFIGYEFLFEPLTES